MTAEVSEAFAEARFTTEKVSFITDEIIVQRYVEMEGELRRVMAVVKMRGSNHSHEFRMYEVTAKGIVVGASLTEYDGILSGTPTLRGKTNGASPLQANGKAASKTRNKVGKVAKARRGR
jgi:circadian clock protein KaiC